MNILLEGIFYNGHGLAEGNRMLLKILVRAGYRVRIKVKDSPDKYTVLHPKEIISPEGPALSLPVPESFKFLSVFDVKKRKGYDLLLNAFLSEFSNADHVTLIIKVRDSTQTEIIEQFIRTHPKPKRKRPHIYISSIIC